METAVPQATCRSCREAATTQSPETCGHMVPACAECAALAPTDLCPACEAEVKSGEDWWDLQVRLADQQGDAEYERFQDGA